MDTNFTVECLLHLSRRLRVNSTQAVKFESRGGHVSSFFIQKILIVNLNHLGASNTEIRYTETQLAGKPIQFQTFYFSLQELFPLKRIEFSFRLKKI